MTELNRSSSMPHRSDPECQAQQNLATLLAESPIPTDELPDNLGLYLGRRQLTDLLAMNTLYDMILDIPGVVMEFGVRWGRHLATLTALRALREPFNVHRRIIGFDTLTGFPDIDDVDRGSRHAVVGGLAVTDDYLEHLLAVLAAHDSTNPLAHISRTTCVVGDIRDTLPRYLEEHPHTVIALAYFDLDLHDPTRAALTSIQPFLCAGSILAFDQLGHAKWPGETTAIREVLGTRTREFHLIPGFPTPAYLQWNG